MPLVGCLEAELVRFCHEVKLTTQLSYADITARVVYIVFSVLVVTVICVAVWPVM